MKNSLLIMLLGCFILVASKPAGTAITHNSVKIADTALFGVFVGRSPCLEIASALDITVAPDCEKLKWKLILYVDAGTNVPSTFKLARTFHRQSIIEGRWSIVRGTKTNKDAIVYRLEKNQSQGAMYLWKVDDNVLFFLDKEGNCLVGNDQYSYTLNRSESKAGE